MSTRRKLLLAIAGAGFVYGLYCISLQFFAYTSDAFVANDVVLVAPEVEGRIVAVHVTDNQVVKAGEPLLTIDETPYALQVGLKTAAVAKAKADADAARGATLRAEADQISAEAHLALTRTTERRYGDLVKLNAAPQQRYDETVAGLKEAEARLKASAALLAAARQDAVAAEAAVAVAERALDLARYNLRQTHIVAPVDGQVNNLWLRVGDYAKVGEPRIGVVAADDWRVVALYKEDAIRHLREGSEVIIYLDTEPFRLLRGRVQGVARAIAHRDQQTALLPEIEPTTGWIRFQRRFPVRIRLEDVPDDIELHVGANARVVTVYGW